MKKHARGQAEKKDKLKLGDLCKGDHLKIQWNI